LHPRLLLDTYYMRQNAKRSQPAHVNGLGLALNVFFRSRAKASQARHAVEARVEAHDPCDLLALHDGRVKGVPGREPGSAQNEVLGALDIRSTDGKDFIHDAENRIEGGLNRLATIDRHVPMQDLLEDLGARHEPFSCGNGGLQQALGVRLVRMGRPH
jgi:hypothetical protein